MSRNALNDAFARTSFLNGVNAAYIEQMQALYERNPGAVSDEWRLFFQSLQEEQGLAEAEASGPSWGLPLERLQTNGNADLVAALTTDYEGAERHLRDQIQARAAHYGTNLSMAASLRATQDSIRALMLIRAYRVMGHLSANLDPLGLSEEVSHRELNPETYGFTEADYDRPIFIDHVLGLETATIRQILRILQRTYCRSIGVEFMHISTPAQKSWIQERIEGEEKDVTFTLEGKKAILNKLIEAEMFEKFCEVKYTGTKRFGLEGGESMVPALEQIIKRGGQLGMKEIVVGMAHRGRLNVLANVMAKPHRAIFNEFKGGSFKPEEVEGSG
ncbi:MAG: 2-oxoglutarate dehydrogenase E1 component, partial [Hyphomicrobiaceae bacterium]|nr:2-oxoglutarate dehydrogenase E1 component [Hyphomicrobiaceae bacterium]